MRRNRIRINRAVVVGEGRDAQRHARWRIVAHHRLQDFEREACALLRRAAVFIFAPVEMRREELVRQVAVSAMQLDRVEPDLTANARCFAEGLDGLPDFLQRQSARGRRLELDEPALRTKSPDGNRVQIVVNS